MQPSPLSTGGVVIYKNVEVWVHRPANATVLVLSAPAAPDYFAHFTLSGTLRSATGAVLAGRKVHLYCLAGGKWLLWRDVVTDAQGRLATLTWTDTTMLCLG